MSGDRHSADHHDHDEHGEGHEHPPEDDAHGDLHTLDRADHDRAHEHSHPTGLKGWVIQLVRPHSHDHSDSLDDTLMVSKAGTRALAISLTGLLVTAEELTIRRSA